MHAYTPSFMVKVYLRRHVYCMYAWGEGGHFHASRPTLYVYLWTCGCTVRSFVCTYGRVGFNLLLSVHEYRSCVYVCVYCVHTVCTDVCTCYVLHVLNLHEIYLHYIHVQYVIYVLKYVQCISVLCTYHTCMFSSTMWTPGVYTPIHHVCVWYVRIYVMCRTYRMHTVIYHVHVWYVRQYVSCVRIVCA